MAAMGQDASAPEMSREDEPTVAGIGQEEAAPEDPFDPRTPLPLEREAPPPASVAPVTYTIDTVADGLNDADFLMSRLGMGGVGEPSAASLRPPPPPAFPTAVAPAASAAASKPPMTDKEIYARKIELIWILRRLRGSDPNFPIPKVSDDLYKMEMLVEQVRRENACSDGIDNCRFALMFFSGMMETAASKPPLNRFLHLKGFSRKLVLDVEQDSAWDECFVALTDKWRQRLPSSPEATLGFLLAKSALTYSFASQFTEQALAGGGAASGAAGPVPPPPAPMPYVAPTPTQPPAKTASQPTQDQINEIMRIMQNRAMQQAPALPGSPAPSSAVGSSVVGKRKLGPGGGLAPAKRQRPPPPSSSEEEDSDDWESSEEDEEDFSSEISSSSEEPPPKKILSVRRRVPLKQKGRLIVPQKQQQQQPEKDEEDEVPVHDVKIPELKPAPPVAAAPRGGGRGRGKRGGRGGAGRAGASVAAPPPASSNAETGSQAAGEDELDMSNFV